MHPIDEFDLPILFQIFCSFNITVNAETPTKAFRAMWNYYIEMMSTAFISDRERRRIGSKLPNIQVILFNCSSNTSL